MSSLSNNEDKSPGVRSNPDHGLEGKYNDDIDEGSPCRECAEGISEEEEEEANEDKGEERGPGT